MIDYNSMLVLKKEYQQLLKKAYHGLGELMHLKAEYHSAIEYYRRELNLADAAKENSGILREIADVQTDQGRYDGSLETLAQAERRIKQEYNCREEKYVMEKAAINTLRCWTYRMMGNTLKAQKEANAAIDILDRYKSYTKDVMMLRSSALNSLAGVHFVTGAYDKALSFYRQCLELEKRIGNKRSLAVISNNLGNIYAMTDEPDKAIPFANRYLTMSEEIGDKNGISIASESLGCLFFACDKYGKAVEFLKRSLRLAQEINSRPGISSTSNNLGFVYFHMGEYDKALDLFKKDREVSGRIGDKRGYARALTNVGSVLVRKGDFKHARSLLTEAISMLQKIGDRSRLVAALQLLAEAMAIGKANKKAAICCADKARNIVGESGLKFRLANCFLTYGKIYAALGDFEKGEENFKKAIALCGKLNQRSLAAEVYFEYARMLTRGAAAGFCAETRSAEYFRKAREIYIKLDLPKKLEEMETSL